jgi:PAP2 superfamily
MLVTTSSRTDHGTNSIPSRSGSNVLAREGSPAGEGTRLPPFGTSRQPIVQWVSSFMARRHSFQVEVLLLTLTYVAYDAGRGLVRGGAPAAIAHARSIAGLERSMGLLHEVDVQRALAHVPGLSALFGFGYDVLHLSVTGGVLIWLFFRHRDAYARVRTTLLGATFLALVGFTVYPSAPPRLAGIGVADTLSLARDTAHSGVLQFLYNPYAAMPSLHMAYAVIAGACLYRWGGHRLVRSIGLAYPIFVAVEVVATGNHFFLDVAAGVAVDVCALAIVSRSFAEKTAGDMALGTSRGYAVLDSLRKDLQRVMARRPAITSVVTGTAGVPTDEPQRLDWHRRHELIEAPQSPPDSPTGAPSPRWPTPRGIPCR